MLDAPDAVDEGDPRAGRPAGGRIAPQAADSTRMSTRAGSRPSSPFPIWMAPSYSAAQGSRRMRGALIVMMSASLARGRPPRGPPAGRNSPLGLITSRIHALGAALRLRWRFSSSRAPAPREAAPRRRTGSAVDPADPRFAARPELREKLAKSAHGYFRFVNTGFAAEACDAFADVVERVPRRQPARGRPRRAVHGDEPRTGPQRLRRLHPGQAGDRPRPLRDLARPRRPGEGLGRGRGEDRGRVSPRVPRRPQQARPGRPEAHPLLGDPQGLRAGSCEPRCARPTR